ncbi:MAG: hypothetical protein Q4E18_10935, partial [Clostridia bacterium]|nr:hypothetical protein [Clostridia bacterium]
TSKLVLRQHQLFESWLACFTQPSIGIKINSILKTHFNHSTSRKVLFSKTSFSFSPSQTPRLTKSHATISAAPIRNAHAIPSQPRNAAVCKRAPQFPTSPCHNRHSHP